MEKNWTKHHCNSSECVIHQHLKLPKLRWIYTRKRLCRGISCNGDAGVEKIHVSCCRWTNAEPSKAVTAKSLSLPISSSWVSTFFDMTLLLHLITDGGTLLLSLHQPLQQVLQTADNVCSIFLTFGTRGIRSKMIDRIWGVTYECSAVYEEI